MLRLKTLKFKSIGRFVDEQTINFDGLGSLVQVDAQNNVTGGSSGSGKSTIFNALDFLLGLSDLSTGVLQSRLSREHISVKGEFDWDGRQVCIHRAKKLTVVVDNVEISGSSKLAEEELDKILGIPRHLFKLLLHRVQGKSGFFLEFTPAKMNEFLVDCLGLSSVSAKIDSVDLKIKDLDQAKGQLQSALQAAQAGLKATQDAFQSLGNSPVLTIKLDSVDQAKKDLDLWLDRYESLKQTHVKELDTLNQKKPKLAVVPFDRSFLRTIEEELAEVESEINKLMESERNRQNEIQKQISDLKLDTNAKISALKLENGKQTSSLKAKIVELTQVIKAGEDAKRVAVGIGSQLKVLRGGVCHTCEQSWITDKSKIEEQRLLKELGHCRVAIEASSKANEEIVELKNNFALLTENLNKEVLALETQLAVSLVDLTQQTKPQIPVEIADLNIKLGTVKEKKIKEYFKEDQYNDTQLALNKQAMEAFLLEQRTLVDNHKDQMEKTTNELQILKFEYDNNVSILKSYELALDRYKNSTDSLKKKEEESVLKLNQIDQKLTLVVEDLEIIEEIKRCLKSYLSCSFDDALESISERATQILRSVPTMANATIRLESTKETTAGAIKNQINAQIDSDGELNIPIKSLSGGERSAVDLAIDFAVVELIQEKGNVGIDLMLLDEVFGGFDSVGIENALEMLKTLNKRILLVEHNTLAKEFVQDKIVVIRDGETSYLKNSS